MANTGELRNVSKWGRGKTRATSDSPKTPKSMATRQKILDVATDLMLDRGSTDFTMSEVSERLKMSKGSLYYYFGDKEDLIEAVFDATLDDLVFSMRTAVEGLESSHEALVGMVTELCTKIQERSPLALAMTRELERAGESVLPSVHSYFSQVCEMVMALIEQGREEGLVARDIDARLCATYVTGGFFVTAISYARGLSRPDGPEPKEPGELAEFLVSRVLVGIGSPSQE